MGKSYQRKQSTFNAGRDMAIKMKDEVIIGEYDYVRIEKSDGSCFCPYITNCKMGKLWMLGWHCGWKYGKSAYYKG